MLKPIDTYENYGMAFYGINSKPIKVLDDVYQIKCMVTKPCNYSEYEMKYLQFTLNNEITLDFLNSLKSNYILSSKYSYFRTNNSNVRVVNDISELKNVKPYSYNVKNIHSLFLRLCKLKEQDKPILK